MADGPMTISGLQAVLFDLDGTLLDSTGDIVKSCNFALEQAGRAPLPEAEIASFVGDGARRLVARAFRLSHKDPAVEPHLEVFLNYYAEHPADHSVVLPGVEAAMRACSERSLRLGLCTNKARRTTDGVLRAFGWELLFGAVVAGGDTEFLKPRPEPILELCRRLEVEPTVCLMVGDGPQDVVAAKAAGVRVVAVRGGFGAISEVRKSEPEWLLDSMMQLVPLLDELCGESMISS